MKHNYRIQHDRYLLRPLERFDLEELRVLRNKNRNFFIQQEIILAEEQKKWYESYLSKDDDFMFAVEHENFPSKMIGSVGIYHIDQENQSAEFGRIMIDKEICDINGLGYLVTHAICKFAFETFCLEKIILKHFKSNVIAEKIYDKVGFQIKEDIGDIYEKELTKEYFMKKGANP